jgi:hypothetical protein
LVDRAGFAREQEKRRLEDVLGVLLMTQHAPGDVEDHRSVPLEQCCKGGLITVDGKTLEQLAIAGLV